MPSALEQAALRWRARLLANERQALTQMLRVHEAAWQRLEAEIDGYTARIESGDPLLPGLLHRRAAAQDMQRAIDAELQRLAQAAEVETVRMQRQAVDAAQASIQDMVAAQDAGVALQLRRPNARAVEALVGYASDGSPLREVFESATQGQAGALTELLARNVGLGVNPRVTARQMRNAFGMSLTRARTIARTESLRAFRTASQMTMEENADIIDGWVWTSALSARTCPVCFAMHNTWHPLTEKMAAHVNCRCVASPRVRGAPRPTPNGDERFRQLTPEQQRAALGPAAYEAYRDGAFGLADLVGRTRSRRWGESVHVRSLSSVLGEERAAGYNRYVQITAHNKALSNLGEVDRKWLLAGLGARPLPDAELPEMLAYVAGQKFLVNTAGDRTDNNHFKKHVRKRGEWPPDTSLDGYLQSVADAVRSPQYVFTGLFQGRHWTVTLVAPSGAHRGPGGSNVIMVEYRVGRGIATGFQPRGDTIEGIVGHPDRSEVRWVRRP